MPELSWEPLDFLEALGVAPEEEEEPGVSYHYVVTRLGLRLELTVWPMSSDIALSLYSAHQTEPVVRLNLLECPAARVVRDKNSLFIEFAGANLFSGRYGSAEPAPYGFRLWLKPFIQVVPYSYET